MSGARPPNKQESFKSPEVVLEKIYLKFSEKLIFFIIWNKSQKILEPHPGGGALPGSTPAGPKDVPREKIKVTFLNKFNSSLQTPRPKVIAHSFFPLPNEPLLGINSNIIGVNVQVYTISNKVMSVQNRLHRDWCHSKCYSNHNSANSLLS